LNKGLLQLVLGELVHVFLVVSDDALGDGLSDGVDLRSVTTTGNADSDVDVGELFGAEDQDGFIDLDGDCVRLRISFARSVCDLMIVSFH
jgi:hypothetical protein